MKLISQVNTADIPQQKEEIKISKVIAYLATMKK